MAIFDTNLLQEPIGEARSLLGAIIVRTLSGGQQIKARIIETESYFEADPASHTHRGRSPRNAAMFGPPGHAYIYLSYGMHWCMNVTAGPDGEGILIRAVEPLEGLGLIRQLRGGIAKNTELTNGPGKVGQALAINKSLYGHSLAEPPLQLYSGEIILHENICVTPRIGISRAAEQPLRFYIKANPYVSKRPHSKRPYEDVK